MKEEVEKERRGAPKKGSRRALAATLRLLTARLSVTLCAVCAVSHWEDHRKSPQDPTVP